MNLRTFGFPGRYVQGPGALGEAGRAARDIGASSALVIADPQVPSPADTLRAALADAGLAVTTLDSEPECTQDAARRLASQADGFDLVVGFGGGKTIDLSKAVARSAGARLMIAPSIASNDAPTSRLIVFYDAAHKVDEVVLTARNPDVVLVDTAVIAQAPARFFAAGMADAMSKTFEVGQCAASGGTNFFGTRPLATATLLADAAHRIILAHGRSALDAVEQGEASADVEAVVEASVLLSGLAFESGGLSLAHALLRGLTALPGCAARLHGELVAFGTLVQMVHEGRPEPEIAEHAAFYGAMGLPRTLAEVADGDVAEAERRVVAALTCQAPYIHNLVEPADENGIMRAMERLEDQRFGSGASSASA